MFAKNSYLVLAGMFLLFGFYSCQNNNAITAVVFVWFSVVFFIFWLIHFFKVNYYKDYAPLLVRDSFLKYFIFGVLLFPFFFIKYLSLLIQSFSGEESISKITEKVFMGQQLLWFHQNILKSKNINAVLDSTVENREPFFISMNESINYLRIPVLDKTSPTIEQLETGVRWAIDRIAKGSNIYVHCGAGHERSAVFVAAILLKMGECETLPEAIELIRRNRPKARFVGNQQMVLEQWMRERTSL